MKRVYDHGSNVKRRRWTGLQMRRFLLGNKNASFVEHLKEHRAIAFWERLRVGRMKSEYEGTATTWLWVQQSRQSTFEFNFK